MAKKILIVDDEAEFLDMMRMRISAAGFSVLTAYDGKDALSKIRLARPDLVLSDVFMPKADGVDLFKEMRSNKETKNLPIIIMSAHDNIEQGFRAVGANDFVKKPFDSQELIEKIQSCLFQKLFLRKLFTKDMIVVFFPLWVFFCKARYSFATHHKIAN